ncbi:GlxA family transcriptional regulator [Marivita sp. S6314]|uniref:GlxA family transcriptional regulator n=1 Tax=Marivita sp. S6314 TaxID=2926406 RepID=UPI001FF6F979|nr:GlxA family transcriptional regulator [Marivita sp. S6314]MCK0151605.1 GlxA family transcriptional regulator [Marivita sp. S6314]
MAEPASDTHRTPVIPDGAFSFPITQPRETRWFNFLLLDGFTLLAFSSAVDPLRIANQVSGAPLYGWHVVSETGASVASSSGLSVEVHGALAGVDDKAQIFVCAGNQGHVAASEATIAELRRRARFGSSFGAICTGAATLARAGLLDGKRFTLHWENQPGFIEAFPTLEPTRNRFEEDGDLLTCGGGSAATEMILTLIARDYGTEFAVLIADMCLNDPELKGRRDQRSSIATAVDSRNPKLLQVVQGMYAHIEEPLTLEDLAAHAGVSRRQMERQFRKLLGEAPAAVYRNIRLERGRALLVETDMTVMEVSTAVGFNSVNVFSRHFKARYGETPYGARGKRG